MSPPVRPERPDIENALAESANAAIAAGKPVDAVNARLSTAIQHLRAHPDIAQQANDALAQGKDVGAIGARIYQHAQQTPSAPSTPAERQYTPGQEFGTLIAQGATMGFAPKILGGLDAADKYLHGDHNFGANYAATRDRIAGAETAAMRDHPIASPAVELLSGIGTALPAAATGATGKAVSAVRTALPSRIAQGAVAGAGYGALQGAGHATGDVGDYAREMTSGAVSGAAIGATLPIVGAGVSRAGSLAIDILGRPIESTPLLRIGNLGLGRIEGVRDRAMQAIERRAAQDAASGFVPPPAHPSLPSMPLDRAGPNVEGYAEGIANRPGPGRSILVNAILNRQRQMRPAITSAFNEATGTTPESGASLIRSLGDEHAAMDRTRAITDQVTQEAKTALPDVQTPVPANVWAHSIGGQHPNAIERLRTLDNAQRTEAGQLYGAAREATAGQPMTSPTLDRFLETPVGKQALAWAKMQKANRLGTLAKLTEPSVDENVVRQLTEMGVHPDKATAAATGTVEREVPDPETLHYMKQYVAKVARLGVNDGAQGTIAVQAQGALPTFDAIRSELPEPWQRADAAYAGWERKKAALNAGRNLLRTQVNPAGTGRKPLTNSLDAIAQQVAKMSPDEQREFRIGAQGAISDYLRSGKSTASFIRDMSNPSSDLARKVVLATGDENAPARLAQQLQSRTFPQQIPAPPPEPTLSSEGQGAAMGLDVLKHKVSPPGNAPEKSLTLFGDRANALDPQGKVTLQQGAAQAVRGQWDRAGRSVQSPGRVFDFSSPEKALQMSYAFQSPAKQADFERAVTAWDAAQAQANRITGNSRTGLRGAEGSGMTVPASSILSGAKAVAKKLITKATGSIAIRNQQALEEQVARLLTDPQFMALPAPNRAAQLHDGILRAVHENLLTAAPTPSTPQPQQRH